MARKLPEDMDELVYFTRRKLGDKGLVIAWANRGECPKCGKDKMGKPKDPKTGKAKIRAKEYECPACHHIIEKDEYEATLTVEAIYTCPSCGKDGDDGIPFKRKRIQLFDKETQKKKAADAFRFNCKHCDANIDVTKKMKA